MTKTEKLEMENKGKWSASQKGLDKNPNRGPNFQRMKDFENTLAVYVGIMQQLPSSFALAFSTGCIKLIGIKG